REPRARHGAAARGRLVRALGRAAAVGRARGCAHRLGVRRVPRGALSVARALRLLRASAGLVVHPPRLRRWRAHLSRAWHQPGGGGSARPARTPGPRPREVRVLVHADERLVALLRPEWRQVTWDGAAVPPDV